MTTDAKTPTRWRTASACAQTNCVEIGFTDDAVLFRDRNGQVLRASLPAWRVLAESLRGQQEPKGSSTS